MKIPMVIYEQASEALLLNQVRGDRSFSNCHVIRNILSKENFTKLLIKDVVVESSTLEGTLFNESFLLKNNYLANDLKFSEFINSEMEECVFDNSHLIKANFSNAKLVDVVFNDCVIHGASFNSGSLLNVKFSKCQMYNARFGKNVLVRCGFNSGRHSEISEMNKASFQNSIIIDCSFVGMNLTENDFRGATLIGCSFEHSILDDVDFTGARILNCSFVKCDTKTTIWNADGNINV